MVYERINTTKGIKYRGDKKFISKDKIPIAVLERLGHEEKVKFNACIFCRAEGKRQRLVSGVMVALCDEDFYSKTIGVITARLRERNNNGVHET